MTKFGERELTENLKDFEDNSKIELEFDRCINGKVLIEQAKIEYDGKHGYINIMGNNSSFRINTTLVFGYEKIEDELYVDLDSLILKVKKIKD